MPRPREGHPTDAPTRDHRRVLAPVVSDCSECRGVRTVFFGVCSVCFAEFDEWHGGDALVDGVPPPAAIA